MEALPTRRAFLAALAAAGAGSLLARRVETALGMAGPADVTLRIDRLTVEIAPGHLVTTTAYNSGVPGPLIRLREGVPVVIDLFNHTDLPEYVHWHGFSVPAAIDGTEEENSLAVAAHGRLRYRLTPEAAGSRYVHSHAMPGKDLTRGVFSGQFGFVYVEPRSDPGRYDREVFLATHEWQPFYFDDDGDDDAGGVEIFGERDWDPSSAEVAYRISSINGKALGHGEPIRVKEGERVLFHLLNASATEDIQLSLPGHDFIVLALDGNPVPSPRRVGVLELGTGERVDAVVEMKNPGIWILGSTDDDVRGHGLGILVEYAGRKGIAGRSAPLGSTWDYALFGEDRASPVPAEIIPLVIEWVEPGADGFERWTINGRGYDPSADPRVLRQGRRYRLILDNQTTEAHPLHLHRNTFELTSIDGKRTAGVKKDVVVVKPYQVIAVDFVPNQDGPILFHCHQQMHMECGLKALFTVGPKTRSRQLEYCAPI